MDAVAAVCVEGCLLSHSTLNRWQDKAGMKAKKTVLG